MTAEQFIMKCWSHTVAQKEQFDETLIFSFTVQEYNFKVVCPLHARNGSLLAYKLNSDIKVYNGDWSTIILHAKQVQTTKVDNNVVKTSWDCNLIEHDPMEAVLVYLALP